MSKIKRKNRQSQLAPIMRIFAYVKHYKLVVLIGVIAMFITTGASVMMGQGIRVVIDNAVIHYQEITSYSFDIVFYIVLFIIVYGVAVFLRGYCMAWVSVRVTEDLRVDIFKNIIAMSPGCIDELYSGDIQTRIISDTNELGLFLTEQIPVLLASTIMLVGGLIGAVYISLEMTLLVAVCVPLIFLPFIIFSKKLNQVGESIQTKIADTGRYAGEVFRNIKTVQAYNQQQTETERFLVRAKSVSAHKLCAAQLEFGLLSLILSFAFAGFIGLLWGSSLNIISGNITIGDLVAFAFYTGMIVIAAGDLFSLVTLLNIAAGTAKKIMQHIDAGASLFLPKQKQNFIDNTAGHIEFRDVYFTYPSRPESTVLNGVNLLIEPGSRLALVGPSGSGKSTLLDLLMCFYEPQSGQISVNGVELCNIDMQQWRNQLAYISQKDSIISGSIIDNIRYGYPDASDEQVSVAAQKAYAHDFINNLPDAYQTDIGEMGTWLSGGQRQRIALARAFILEPTLLLMDEATSALDSVSERFIEQSLGNMSSNGKQITTIVIAHRLSTAILADKVAVMDNGKIIAQGCHEELLKQCNVYKTLCNEMILETNNS